MRQFLQVTTISLLSLAIISCNADNDRKIILERHCQFNPSTILESIESGDRNRFTLVENTVASSQTFNTYARWNQQDYFVIANAIHDLLDGTSSKNWEIEDMSFNLKCSDVEFGAQGANITFLKEGITFSGPSSIERQITIIPGEGAVDVWEFSYQSFRGSEAININTIAFFAEDILKIAEDNGALEERDKVNNECEISMILSPKLNHQVWEVNYFPGVYSLSIDAQTGDIIK
ncbi:MAG TPA: hypothetical protein DIW27_06310 [Cytophagales bacterium]|nr:hypothetical protein [Cytophagales bacterium]